MFLDETRGCSSFPGELISAPDSSGRSPQIICRRLKWRRQKTCSRSSGECSSQQQQQQQKAVNSRKKLKQKPKYSKKHVLVMPLSLSQDTTERKWYEIKVHRLDTEYWKRKAPDLTFTALAGSRSCSVFFFFYDSVTTNIIKHHCDILLTSHVTFISTLLTTSKPKPPKQIPSKGAWSYSDTWEVICHGRR